MITLRRKEPFDFCCGSGALGFDGLGWPWEAPLRWAGILRPQDMVVVCKTVTAEPVRGNLRWYCPWRSVQLLSGDGAINAVGLTNCGVEYWVEYYYPKAKKRGYRLSVSVKADTIEEARKICMALTRVDCEYVELNVSCPNVAHEDQLLDIVSWFRDYLYCCGTPLVLKLAARQVSAGFVREVDGLVDAWHAINTIPWSRAWPTRTSPLKKYPHGQEGGVSGAPIHTAAVAAVRLLNTLTEKPIIGGGGIMDLDGVRRFAESGADAFSIGTLFLRRPWAPNRLIREYRDSLDADGRL